MNTVYGFTEVRTRADSCHGKEPDPYEVLLPICRLCRWGARLSASGSTKHVPVKSETNSPVFKRLFFNFVFGVKVSDAEDFFLRTAASALRNSLRCLKTDAYAQFYKLHLF
jgi:hypothetical protein